MSASEPPKSGPVRLVAYSESWPAFARGEAERLHAALDSILLDVHHVGSTAIPWISAKPIVDLIPVVRDLAALDAARERLETHGYAWWGEYGIAGRRFCTRNDADDGRRVVNAHFYAEGDPEIERHVAFRDYLRANPDVARQYETLKTELAARYRDDVAAYADAKTPWIRSIEPTALAYYQQRC